jgi:two-component system, sensor histidine kinase RegB
MISPNPVLDREAIEAQALKANYRQLIHMRGMAFYGQVATIFGVYYGLNLVVPVTPMLWVSAALVGFNLICLWRYRHDKVLSEAELFLGLSVDVIGLSGLLALSGGASNPFVTLYLLPVIIASVLLRPVFAWGVLALSLVGYALLGLIPTPYPAHEMHMHMGAEQALFNLHTQGMMIAFAVSAIMLVIFVTRIRGNLTERDLKLAQLEQQSVEEAQIVRIGLLGAGAAHELGTPLTTLAVTLKDWRDFTPPGKKAERNAELDMLLAQVARCKAIVSDILRASGDAQGQEGRRQKLSQALAQVTAKWQVGQDARLDLLMDLEHDPVVIFDRTLEQALFNLLDNAREASAMVGHTYVGLNFWLKDADLWISVRDMGEGMSPDIAARLGQPYVSSKGAGDDGNAGKIGGHGMGLFLVINTLRKLGGELKVEDNIDDRGCKCGTVMRARLPIDAIRADRLEVLPHE